jgi:hypothetical protein
MLILIGCESSGIGREAFRRLGYDAYSCDLLPASDGSPYHIQGDIFTAIASRPWEVLIVHPMCTYLCASGLHWNKRRPGRAVLTEQALEFVARLWHCDIDRVCLENPQGCINTRLEFMPKPQYIQPYQFGEDASKRTGLWKRGLLDLKPTRRIAGRQVFYNGKTVERWSNQTDSGQNRLGPSPDRWQVRSQSYPGILNAMALQWAGDLLN